MIAGVSLEEAVSAIGHSRGTYTRDLVKALRHFGKQCGDKLIRPSAKNPMGSAKGIAAMLIEYPDGNRVHHWVVQWKGRMLDPDWSPDLPLRPGYWDLARLTSYLPVYSNE